MYSTQRLLNYLDRSWKEIAEGDDAMKWPQGRWVITRVGGGDDMATATAKSHGQRLRVSEGEGGSRSMRPVPDLIQDLGSGLRAGNHRGIVGRRSRVNVMSLHLPARLQPEESSIHSTLNKPASVLHGPPLNSRSIYASRFMARVLI